MCKCCCKIKEIDSKLNKFLTDKADVEDLATIATTGLYSDLLNNPLKTLIDSEDVLYHDLGFATTGSDDKMNYAVYTVFWSGHQDRKLLPGETVKIYINNEEFAEGIITCDDVVDQSTQLTYYINYLNSIDAPENSWWLVILHFPTTNDSIVLFIKNLDIIENKPNIKLYTIGYKINSVPYESILGNPLKNKISLVESTVIFEGSRKAVLMGPNHSGIPFYPDDSINVKEGQIIKIYLNGEDQGSAEVFVSSTGRFANLLNQVSTYSDSTWCFVENNTSGVNTGQLCFPGLDLLNTSPTIKIVLMEYKLDVKTTPEINIINNNGGSALIYTIPNKYNYLVNSVHTTTNIYINGGPYFGTFEPLLKCYVEFFTDDNVTDSIKVYVDALNNSGNTCPIYWEKPFTPVANHKYIFEITMGVNFSACYISYKEFSLG